MSVFGRYKRHTRRRRRRADATHKRLDIQGLRMVAVLTVFANHLWGWPRGGFVGVDVFFVISGFLITGNLLRTAETTGTISFWGFYKNRIRRIVPAATLVLVLSYGVSRFAFLPFRAHQVGVDALFAFGFGSNWWFAHQGTDYFRAASNFVSPIQHYWSLSIEEQFYFVWPAVILAISVLVIRKGWTHAHRMQLAGGVMGIIVAVSLAWALYQTAVSPTAAYFNTFARAWELGVGALLATATGLLARIPQILKPVFSWTGLLLIAASLWLVDDASMGFPAPWAILPVAGGALVIASGVGGEPKYQEFLRNPVSTYVGDISYSLYLVHWPVIIFLGALMDHSYYFHLTAVALSLSLAIASFHCVENPLRRASLGKFRQLRRQIRKRTYSPQKSSQYAMVGAMALLVVALTGFMMRPDAYAHASPPPINAVSLTEADPAEPKLPPLTAALQVELTDALKAKEWPPLDPSMETVFSGIMESPDVAACHTQNSAADPALCTWGASSAPIRVVLAGDSVAEGYAGPLREIALNSGGLIQVTSEAMSACAFANDLIERPSMSSMCAPRKQHIVDLINRTKPQVVIISNRSSDLRLAGSQKDMKPVEWGESLRQIVEKFRSNAGKIVFLSPPPSDLDIQECVSKRSNTPADCLDTANNSKHWNAIANVERKLAADIGGVWLDSRPWFCVRGKYCPAFAGTTPTKFDWVHMAPAYGHKIAPVIGESLSQAGVF
jgi:peptidoglycan/LPS O-acetylase OafA/YrhL